MRYKRGDIVEFSLTDPAISPAKFEGVILETVQRRCHIKPTKKDGKSIPKKNQDSVAVGYEYVRPKQIKLN